MSRFTVEFVNKAHADMTVKIGVHTNSRLYAVTEARDMLSAWVKNEKDWEFNGTTENKEG
jgi:hypothetical protein